MTITGKLYRNISKLGIFSYTGDSYTPKRPSNNIVLFLTEPVLHNTFDELWNLRKINCCALALLSNTEIVWIWCSNPRYSFDVLWEEIC